MAWLTPKTTWGTEIVSSADLMRIEGNIDYLYNDATATSIITKIKSVAVGTAAVTAQSATRVLATDGQSNTWAPQQYIDNVRNNGATLELLSLAQVRVAAGSPFYHVMTIVAFTDTTKGVVQVAYGSTGDILRRWSIDSATWSAWMLDSSSMLNTMDRADALAEGSRLIKGTNTTVLSGQTTTLSGCILQHVSIASTVENIGNFKTRLAPGRYIAMARLITNNASLARGITFAAYRHNISTDAAELITSAAYNNNELSASKGTVIYLEFEYDGTYSKDHKIDLVVTLGSSATTGITLQLDYIQVAPHTNVLLT